MGLLSWIVFGAVAGWVASLITHTNERQGCLMNVLVGVVGAFLGGLLIQLITGEGVSFGWTLSSFLVAVLGAVLLLVITGAVRKR